MYINIYIYVCRHIYIYIYVNMYTLQIHIHGARHSSWSPLRPSSPTFTAYLLHTLSCAHTHFLHTVAFAHSFSGTLSLTHSLSLCSSPTLTDFH